MPVPPLLCKDKLTVPPGVVLGEDEIVFPGVGVPAHGNGQETPETNVAPTAAPPAPTEYTVVPETIIADIPTSPGKEPPFV